MESPRLRNSDSPNHVILRPGDTWSILVSEISTGGVDDISDISVSYVQEQHPTIRTRLVQAYGNGNFEFGQYTYSASEGIFDYYCPSHNYPPALHIHLIFVFVYILVAKHGPNLFQHATRLYEADRRWDRDFNWHVAFDSTGIGGTLGYRLYQRANRWWLERLQQAEKDMGLPAYSSMRAEAKNQVRLLVEQMQRDIMADLRAIDIFTSKPTYKLHSATKSAMEVR